MESTTHENRLRKLLVILTLGLCDPSSGPKIHAFTKIFSQFTHLRKFSFRNSRKLDFSANQGNFRKIRENLLKVGWKWKIHVSTLKKRQIHALTQTKSGFSRNHAITQVFPIHAFTERFLTFTQSRNQKKTFTQSRNQKNPFTQTAGAPCVHIR